MNFIFESLFQIEWEPEQDQDHNTNTYLTRPYTLTRSANGAMIYAITLTHSCECSTTHDDQYPARCTVTSIKRNITYPESLSKIMNLNDHPHGDELSRTDGIYTHVWLVTHLQMQLLQTIRMHFRRQPGSIKQLPLLFQISAAHQTLISGVKCSGLTPW